MSVLRQQRPADGQPQNDAGWPSKYTCIYIFIRLILGRSDPMKPAFPSSNAFWILSSSYRDAGDAAFDRMRSSSYRGSIRFACFFLYFRCVELALKAVLTHHRVAEREITQTLGHRISALLTRTESFSPLHGLGITRENRRLLDQFSDDYADKWFEYPDKIWRREPKFEELRALAHRMCDTIRVYGRKTP